MMDISQNVDKKNNLVKDCVWGKRKMFISTKKMNIAKVKLF